MSRSLKTVLLIYGVSIAVGFIFPFLCECGGDDPIKLSLDIVRTISILAASVTAMLFFDPHGLRKKNRENQFLNVIKVLEKVKGKMFMFTYGHQNSIFTITKENIVLFKNDESSFSEYKSCPVSFSTIDWLSFNDDLFELSTNIWTPKVIVNSLLFLQTTLGHDPKLSTEDHVQVVSLKGYLSEDEDQFTQPNAHWTLLEFIDYYDKVLKECETWLAKNSYTSEFLNL